MLIKNIPCNFNTDKPEFGALCVTESHSDVIPFDIKRVYYIYNVASGIIRGFHAHKELQQILVCIYGSIEISLDDGHGNIETKILDNPSVGLYVGPSTWRTMKWLKDNSVLLVFASEHYNEDDYIRNYDEFKVWINQGE